MGATGAALGIAVDPDVDRCVVLDELGRPVGEELTLAACTDYVLAKVVCAFFSSSFSERSFKRGRAGWW